MSAGAAEMIAVSPSLKLALVGESLGENRYRTDKGAAIYYTDMRGGEQLNIQEGSIVTIEEDMLTEFDGEFYRKNGEFFFNSGVGGIYANPESVKLTRTNGEWKLTADSISVMFGNKKVPVSTHPKGAKGVVIGHPENLFYTRDTLSCPIALFGTEHAVQLLSSNASIAFNDSATEIIASNCEISVAISDPKYGNSKTTITLPLSQKVSLKRIMGERLYHTSKELFSRSKKIKKEEKDTIHYRNWDILADKYTVSEEGITINDFSLLDYNRFYPTIKKEKNGLKVLESVSVEYGPFSELTIRQDTSIRKDMLFIQGNAVAYPSKEFVIPIDHDYEISGMDSILFRGIGTKEGTNTPINYELALLQTGTASVPVSDKSILNETSPILCRIDSLIIGDQEIVKCAALGDFTRTIGKAVGINGDTSATLDIYAVLDLSIVGGWFELTTKAKSDTAPMLFIPEGLLNETGRVPLPNGDIHFSEGMAVSRCYIRHSFDSPVTLSPGNGNGDKVTFTSTEISSKVNKKTGVRELRWALGNPSYVINDSPMELSFCLLDHHGKVKALGASARDSKPLDSLALYPFNSSNIAKVNMSRYRINEEVTDSTISVEVEGTISLFLGKAFSPVGFAGIRFSSESAKLALGSDGKMKLGSFSLPHGLYYNQSWGIYKNNLTDEKSEENHPMMAFTGCSGYSLNYDAASDSLTLSIDNSTIYLDNDFPFKPLQKESLRVNSQRYYFDRKTSRVRAVFYDAVKQRNELQWENILFKKYELSLGVDENSPENNTNTSSCFKFSFQSVEKDGKTLFSSKDPVVVTVFWDGSYSAPEKVKTVFNDLF